MLAWPGLPHLLLVLSQARFLALASLFKETPSWLELRSLKGKRERGAWGAAFGSRMVIRKLRRSPCAQLTERETEASIRSARAPSKPLALPMWPNSHNPSWSLVCPPERPQSLGPGCSPALPTPASHTEVGATFPWVFIARQALSPLVSQCDTYLGGIRSQELSGQSSLRP